jgi:hypothetical protein
MRAKLVVGLNASISVTAAAAPKTFKLLIVIDSIFEKADKRKNAAGVPRRPNLCKALLNFPMPGTAAPKGERESVPTGKPPFADHARCRAIY